jgi:hypothetical protein
MVQSPISIGEAAASTVTTHLVILRSIFANSFVIPGAPECYRGDSRSRASPIQISPDADVWSVGCVFSEVATWLVRGPQGLDEYRKIRREWHQQNRPDFLDLGCFHDGITMHDGVQKHHHSLQEACDDLTRAIIAYLIPHMLTRVMDRGPAHMLYNMADNTLSIHKGMLCGPERSDTDVDASLGKSYMHMIPQESGEEFASVSNSANASFNNNSLQFATSVNGPMKAYESASPVTAGGNDNAAAKVRSYMERPKSLLGFLKLSTHRRSGSGGFQEIEPRALITHKGKERGDLGLGQVRSFEAAKS